jgi:hypothetical protein
MRHRVTDHQLSNYPKDPIFLCLKVQRIIILALVVSLRKLKSERATFVNTPHGTCNTIADKIVEVNNRRFSAGPNQITFPVTSHFQNIMHSTKSVTTNMELRA